MVVIAVGARNEVELDVGDNELLVFDVVVLHQVTGSGTAEDSVVWLVGESNEVS